MEPKLKYEEYSIAELEDTLENIDKEMYPERTNEIIYVLKKKREEIEVVNKSIQREYKQVNGKLYTANQTMVATFFGGPIAAILMLASNFGALGEYKLKNITLAVGVLSFAVLILVLHFFSESSPGFIVQLFIVFSARFVCSSYQITTLRTVLCRYNPELFKFTDDLRYFFVTRVDI